MDQQQPQAGWVFTPGQAPEPSNLPPEQPAELPQHSPMPAAPTAPQDFRKDTDHVSWSASEYVAHQKGASWFTGLMFGAVVLAGIVYFVTKDKLSPIVIVFVGVLFAVAGARKPRVLDYNVDDHAVKIGPKIYQYGLFKSFAVSESAVRSISLMPIKRFMPPISIYYDPEDEDEIIAIIGDHLPLEEHRADAIDQLMNRLRF